jgi:uncharacterized protein
MTEKIAVLHHDADFDGLLSKEVCAHFMPEAVCFGWDYGRELPKAKWETYDQIYIVDLSNDELMSRADLRSKIIWIDHHKSAIEKWDEADPPHFPGYRIDGVAACRLAWQWFNHNPPQLVGDMNVDLPDKQMFVDRVLGEPMLLRMAGEYDVWDSRPIVDGEQAVPGMSRSKLALQSGLRQLDDEEWRILIRDCFADPANEVANHLRFVLDIGQRALKAKEKAEAGIVTKYSHDVRFEGLTFLCCNSASFNSQFFTAAIKSHHDALMGWRYDGQASRYTVSLYHAPGHEHHDLSQIAVKYGGGGHRGACGFTCESLPFPLREH